MLHLCKESLLLCWEQGNGSRGAGRAISSACPWLGWNSGCSGAVNSSLPLAKQCHGVSLLLLSPNIGSDPKLGTFERKGNTGGCSGLGVKGFKQNTEQPEGLSAWPQPAQLKPQLRNSSQMPREEERSTHGMNL